VAGIEIQKRQLAMAPIHEISRGHLADLKSIRQHLIAPIGTTAIAHQPDGRQPLQTIFQL